MGYNKSAVDIIVDKTTKEMEDAFNNNDLNYINNFIINATRYQQDYPKIGNSSYIKIAVNLLKITARAKESLPSWNILFEHIKSVIDSDSHLDKSKILRGLI